MSATSVRPYESSTVTVVDQVTTFKAEHAEQIAFLDRKVKLYQKEGDRWIDFWPIFRDTASKTILGDLLFEYYKSDHIDVVAGCESRGFPSAMLLADRLGVGFVPLRKPGKLPGPIFTEDNGKNRTLSVSQGALLPGQRVLVIDDLFAPSEMAVTGINLVKKAGAEPVEFATILEGSVDGKEAEESPTGKVANPLQDQISPSEAAFKSQYGEKIASISCKVKLYPNFPKEGILFKDFWPIFHDATSRKVLGDSLYEYYKSKNIEVIAGYESRGFPPGLLLADRLGVGFVPLTKPGELPGPVYTEDYGKEYGKDTLSISQEALLPGQRVLLIDDLIATGGTAVAGVNLIRKAGGVPVEFASILEVSELEGRKKMGIPTFNLID